MNLTDVSFPDPEHITLNLSELSGLLKNYESALSSSKIPGNKIYFFGKADLLRDIINLKHTQDK